MRLSAIAILMTAAIALTGCICGSGLDPRCAVWCDKKDDDCSCQFCFPQEEEVDNGKCAISWPQGDKK
jgi:hypothetical protein